MAVTGGTVDMKTAVGFPFPQGCTVEGQTANFSVAVPEGQTCELIIYKKGARTSAFSQKMPYSDVAGNLHFLSVVLEQPEDYEYCYKIGGKMEKHFQAENTGLCQRERKRENCVPGS